MKSSILKRIEQVFSSYPGVLWGCCPVTGERFSGLYSHAIVAAVPFSEMVTMKDYREQHFWTVQQGTYPILTEIEERLMDLFGQMDIPCRSALGMDSEKPMTAEFSLKDGARRAGIGWIGKNSLLVTQRYGPRVSLTGVLVNTELITSTSAETCGCGECSRCVPVCPFHAICGKEWYEGINRKELIDYPKCNEGRSRAIHTKLGRKLACGKCIAACPYGIEDKMENSL